MSSQDALDIDHSVQLSEATLSALQIEQQPFGPLVSDSELYLDETTSEQLADVKQALITGDDLLLILGAAGSGKSVLLKQLAEHSGLRIQCFAVNGSPRFSTQNLFAGMLEAFKRPPPEKLKDVLDELIPCLQTMVSRNTLSAIVLDDAHQVSEAELTLLLSSMLYLNSQDETLLRVALSGPTEFEESIPDLLPEGADLPYSSLTIEGMNPARATDYLAYRMTQANFVGEWPFSDHEIETLVAQSGGLPASLHLVTANSLNHRYGPEDQILPEALSDDTTEPFMDSRVGKLAMGAVAAILIVGGLAMFIPEKSETNTDRYTSTELAPVETDAPVTEEQTLRLVETKPFTVTELNEADGAAADESLANTDSPEAPEAETQTTTAANTPSVEPAENSEPSATNIDQQAVATATQGAGSLEALADDVAATTERAPIVIVAAESESVIENTLAASPPPEGSTTDAPAGALPVPNVATTDSQTPVIDAAEADIDPELVGVLESPTWILVQDKTLFTVQMSASRDRGSVESFLKRNATALSTPNSIYTFQRDNATWYALLNGLYPSINAARTAVESMPSSALTNQPWIRNVGRVQDALKAQ